LPNLAVIDIGTNTINLLVAESLGAEFKTLFFERIAAKLGKGGMASGRLTEEAMQRGLDALRVHKVHCKNFQVQDLRITATSAVRSAQNGMDFVAKVKQEFDWEIEVIDGQREAELIWKGVKLTGLLDTGSGLIMDIGGGSTEFILADAKGVNWMKSYDLGVTRLAERFMAHDPFSKEEERSMKRALEEDLKELWKAMESFPCERLIGASGSFNSLSAILAGGILNEQHSICEEIDIQAYSELSARIRSLPFEEREAILGLVPDRVDTIPYSVLLIDTVLDQLDIKEMTRSSYALKEGLMGEMIIR